jgi:uncharacterized protein
MPAKTLPHATCARCLRAELHFGGIIERIVTREHLPLDDQSVIALTRRWIEKAVIGLNLCPFAKPIFANDLIRYCVSAAQSTQALRGELMDELNTLRAADPREVETTLLIHPRVLGEFAEYNAFLDEADAAVAELGLTGTLQVASFHPRYQFSGTDPDDIENYTNRSPYPMLHLLRESSIERAVAAISDPAEIYERNIETMRRLSHAGWRRLWPGEGDGN